jgi:hypothetical protein
MQEEEDTLSESSEPRSVYEEEIFIPDQSVAEADVLFMRLAGLITSLGQAGVLSASGVANGLTTAAAQQRINDLSGLRRGIEVLSERAVEVRKHRQSNTMLSLLQYYIGGENQPLSMRVFQEMAGQVGDQWVKETVRELRNQPFNTALGVNPKSFKPMGLKGKEREAIKSAMRVAANFKQQAVRFPESTDVTKELTMRIPGQGEAVLTFGPLPFPSEPLSLTTTRTFYPRYNNGQADAFVFNQLLTRAHEIFPSDRAALILEFRKQLAIFANEHTRSNGSPAGQMARFMKVMQVGESMRKTRRIPDPLAHYRTVAQNVFRFRRTAIDLDCFADGVWPGSIAGMIEKSIDHQAGLFAFNAHSAAGPWYQTGVLRGNSFGIAVSIADWLFDKLGEYVEDPDEWWEKFMWLRVANCKPKDEVTTREEWTTKTRNIFVLSDFVGFAAALMCRAAMRNLVDFMEGEQNTHNMLGFSHTGGEFNRFVKWMTSKRGPEAVNYSDNVTLFDHEWGWFSFDGSKQEASATVQAAQAFAMHVMKEFWGPLSSLSEENKAAFSEHWVWLTQIYPYIAVDGIALLGNQFFQVIGGSSGSMLTAWLNQLVMGSPLLALVERLKGRVALTGPQKGYKRGPSHWYRNQYLNFEGEKPTGVNHELQTLFNKHGVTITLEGHVPAEAVLRPTKNAIVNLDVLGCDGVFVEEFGVKVWVPVLQRKRVLSSMAFSKRNKEGLKKTTVEGEVRGSAGEPLLEAQSLIQLSIETLVKAHQIYMIGGWAYPDARAGLSALIGTNFRSLIGTATDPLQLLTSFNFDGSDTEEEDDDESLWKGLSSLSPSGERTVSVRGVPTMWEVMWLFTDAEMRGQMLDWLRENWQQQSDAWLLEMVPWREIIELPGGPERLSELVPAEARREVAVILGKTEQPSVGGGTKRAAVRQPLTTTPLKTRKEAGIAPRAPDNPQKGVAPAQHTPGGWLEAAASPEANTWLAELEQYGPVYFVATIGADARDANNLARAQFAERIESVLGGALGRKVPYDRVRKSVELALTQRGKLGKNKQRVFVVTGMDGVPSERVDLASANPKHKFMKKMETLRAANPGDVAIFFK